MTSAVVFGFSVVDGLTPVSGAAPFQVLARQLPRLIVARLNGGGDRGARFFPFIGNDEGRRSFLWLKDLLPAEALARLHGQEDPRCLVDGLIEGDTLRLRVLDADTYRPHFDGELAFDPREPFQAMNRALFEITGALAWPGRPPAMPKLSGDALAWFLIAKDDLLGLEADLVTLDSSGALAAVRRSFRLAPDDTEVRDLLLEINAHLIRRGAELGAVADAMQEACGLVEDDAVDFLFTGGAVLQACDREDEACALYERVVRHAPDHVQAVEKVAALHYQSGDLPRARELLQAARAAGVETTAVLAQLAAVEDRLGDRAARDALCRELLPRDGLNATVVRLLLSFLIEQERLPEALPLAERALEGDPEHLPLWLEKGRILLLLGRAEEAEAALRRSMPDDAVDESSREARRLLRFLQVPDLLAEMRRIESELEGGDIAAALTHAKALARRYRHRAEPWLMVGMVRQRLGHHRRAERVFRRALSLDQDLAEAHNRLGILLVRRGNHRQGYRHLRRAVDLLPQDAAVRIHIAQACRLIGAREEGEEHLRHAERLGAAPDTVALVRREFFP